MQIMLRRRAAFLLLADLAVNVALHAIGEFTFRAFLVNRRMGNLHASFHSALAGGFNQSFHPIGLVQPIMVGEPRLDAAIALHFGRSVNP